MTCKLIILQWIDIFSITIFILLYSSLSSSFYLIDLTCGKLQYIKNGKVIVHGKQGKYRCNEGYKLNGLKERICQADGQWSGQEPICIRKNLSICEDSLKKVTQHFF